MSLVAFIVLAFAAGGLSLLVRGRADRTMTVGLLGLAVVVVLGLLIRPGESVAIAGGRLVTTEYLRLFLGLGTLTGLLVCLVALATRPEPRLPGATLIAFGGLALALSLPDPPAAVAATVVAGLAGVVAALPAAPAASAVPVATRLLRTVGVAGAVGVVLTAWTTAALGARSLEPSVLGLAYLGLVVAVALRFGAIPFHAWAARVADAAPPAALPLLLAWAPAGFAIVALGWINQSIVPLAPSLPAERAVIVAVALLCLVLGAVAAWIQDDVEHLVGYGVVADAGVILLALGTIDPRVLEPARSWIVAFAVARTAFAVWAVALGAAYGTRRIDDLAGWIRRAPTLAVAGLLVAVVTLGLPGLAAFEARQSIIRLAVDGPLGGLVALAPFAALLYYGRLAAIGLRRPGAAVAAGRTEVPQRLELPPFDTSVALDAPVEPASDQADAMAAGPTAGQRARVLGRQAARYARAIGPALDLNRTPVAAGLVLVLALTAAAVAAGGFGLAGAAGAPLPGGLAGRP